MTSENPNSLPKQEAVEQLQKTIEQLETIVQKLNTNSLTVLPSSTVIDNLAKTTTELETAISQTEIIPNKQEDTTELKTQTDSLITPQKKTIIIEPNTAEDRDVVPNIQPQKTPITAENTAQKSVIENQPKAKNRQRLFIAVAIAILTLIPISWKLFLANKPATLIAQDPLQTIVETETETKVREIEPTITDDSLTEVVPLDSEPLAEPNPEIPPVIAVDKRPKKVAVKTIKVAKNLTPEQSLIAAIENKERELVNNYANDLVVSIEPNFDNSLVTVILADEWYDLAANEQDKMTEEILKKAWQLKFGKLKIVDSQSNLIARNPVVGKNIIILKRTI